MFLPESVERGISFLSPILTITKNHERTHFLQTARRFVIKFNRGRINEWNYAPWWINYILKWDTWWKSETKRNLFLEALSNENVLYINFHHFEYNHLFCYFTKISIQLNTSWKKNLLIIWWNQKRPQNYFTFNQ
jgi:hypothetical protein